MDRDIKQNSSLLILIITTCTSFMTAFMGSALNIALPILGKEFLASALTLSWISTIYLLTTAALLIPAGKLADTYGRMIFFQSGVLIFSLGSVFCGFAVNEVMLFIFRGVQGVGAALIFSCSTALLVSSYPQNQRGKIIGINTAAVYTGLSSGPFIGGLITGYWGWQYIFGGTAFLGVVILIFSAVYFTKEKNELTLTDFDIGGTLILISTILFIMIGLSLLPKLTGWILMAAGAFSSCWFYAYEQRVNDPLVMISLFHENKTFTFSNSAALINYCATSAVSFLMSFYLQTVKMLTPKEAGIILITQPVVQALFSPLAGKISDSHEPRIVSSSGMAIIAAGLIVFSFINPNSGYIIIVGNLALLGFGFALFSSPNANAIMSSVEKKHYSMASSTLALMRLTGQMLSMGILIVIFTMIIGNAQISAENQIEFLKSMHIAFILFSILCFFGILASLARGKIHS